VVLFVGFQAENTLGRKILDGQSPVPIFGADYEIRAQVRRAEGYSAHADRNELRAWVRHIQEHSQLKQILLVHGEEESSMALADSLRRQGVPSIDIPERGQVVELTD